MAATTFILTVLVIVAALMFLGGLFTLIIAGAWLTVGERPGLVTARRPRVALACGAIAAASLTCLLATAATL